jgi:hypothetical protein
MCVAALPAALAIAQAAVSYVGATQEANATNALYDQNKAAAVAAANDRYAALNNKTLQEREAASQELFQKQIDALKARATATVSAGESGVTGLSVDALMGDMLAQQARQTQAIQTNYDIQRQYNADEGVATYHNTVARINSARQAARPSPIPYLLQGIGNAIRPTGAPASA